MGVFGFGWFSVKTMWPGVWRELWGDHWSTKLGYENGEFGETRGLIRSWACHGSRIRYKMMHTVTNCLWIMVLCCV